MQRTRQVDFQYRQRRRIPVPSDLINLFTLYPNATQMLRLGKEVGMPEVRNQRTIAVEIRI
jgi:hypothetical protein